MLYRKANDEDILKIANLHTQSWKEHYKEILSEEYLEEKVLDDRIAVWDSRLNNPEKDQLVLLVETQNKDLCGFSCAYGNHHRKYGTIIENIHVDLEFQGLGLGTKLLVATAKWAAKNFAEDGLYLEVLEDNKKAQEFYKSLGATNTKKGYWSAPSGDKVPEFVYTWESSEKLANKQLRI